MAFRIYLSSSAFPSVVLPVPETPYSNAIAVVWHDILNNGGREQTMTATMMLVFMGVLIRHPPRK